MFFPRGIWGFSESIPLLSFVLSCGFSFLFVDGLLIYEIRRGCAAFVGRDVSKLKGKGGGKFKYMSEKDMLELAAKFAPYR